MEQLRGPAITCDGVYRMRPKLPGSRSTAFAWHQDSQCYGSPTRHLHMVTCWIPLVDTDEANGCLWVIPGSHRWELLEVERRDDGNLHQLEDVEKRGKAVPLPMRRGDFVVFTNMTFHGSRLNETNRMRWSLDARFHATPGSAPMSDQETEGYKFLYNEIGDLWPLIVRDSDSQRETSWERWQAAYQPDVVEWD